MAQIPIVVTPQEMADLSVTLDPAILPALTYNPSLGVVIVDDAGANPVDVSNQLNNPSLNADSNARRTEVSGYYGRTVDFAADLDPLVRGQLTTAQIDVFGTIIEQLDAAITALEVTATPEMTALITAWGTIKTNNPVV